MTPAALLRWILALFAVSLVTFTLTTRSLHHDIAATATQVSSLRQDIAWFAGQERELRDETDGLRRQRDALKAYVIILQKENEVLDSQKSAFEDYIVDQQWHGRM